MEYPTVLIVPKLLLQLNSKEVHHSLKFPIFILTLIFFVILFSFYFSMGIKRQCITDYCFQILQELNQFLFTLVFQFQLNHDHGLITTHTFSISHSYGIPNISIQSLQQFQSRHRIQHFYALLFLDFSIRVSHIISQWDPTIQFSKPSQIYYYSKSINHSKSLINSIKITPMSRYLKQFSFFSSVWLINSILSSSKPQKPSVYLNLYSLSLRKEAHYFHSPHFYDFIQSIEGHSLLSKCQFRLIYSLQRISQQQFTNRSSLYLDQPIYSHYPAIHTVLTLKFHFLFAASHFVFYAYQSNQQYQSHLLSEQVFDCYNNEGCNFQEVQRIFGLPSISATQL